MDADKKTISIYNMCKIILIMIYFIFAYTNLTREIKSFFPKRKINLLFL